MAISKTKIDRSGASLAKDQYKSDEDYIELEDVFNEYRTSHLQPLSETTLELQGWLAGYGTQYYIAQRLKRKPQILRELRRLSVRLSQLQDIGGCRIIVPKNTDVDKLFKFIQEHVKAQSSLSIERCADYREKGRDRTGYRALHLIMNRDGRSIELQIRSRVQHYWAESIERTSVIYGYHLKEEEGHPLVLSYFRTLSDAFYELEAGRTASTAQKLEIEGLRDSSEKIIADSPRGKAFDSYVNEGIIKTLSEKESKGRPGLNNWIIVFDWNTGSFVSWEIVSRDSKQAVDAYVKNEKTFPTEGGFEVVLIGSSDVATVRQTHSHYFGIESYDTILETLDKSIAGFRRKVDLDIGARQILHCLQRRHCWGNKSVSVQTLRNHYCQNILTFDDSLEALSEKGLILRNGGISLNISKKQEIESYL